MYFQKKQKLLKKYDLNYIYFEDYYFFDHRNYNKLLLKKEFFEKFDNYNNILIYQLDCYIIKDFKHLDKFSKYDYVGSPHINKEKEI